MIFDDQNKHVGGAAAEVSGETLADDPGLNGDAIDLHYALSELVRVYQFRDRQRICCHDISVTQCYALDALVRLGSVPMNTLATELYLDKSTTSRVVDSLERKGLTRRLSDPSDKRVVLIEATPAGVELHARIERGLIHEKKHLLADFDPEVRQATVRLIARLARAATARFEGWDAGCCGGKTNDE